MKVAVDSTPLLEKTGGIARYTEELSRALAETFPDDTVILLSDQDVTRPDGPANLRCAPKGAAWMRRRWWSAGLPLSLWRDHVDVFHGTDFAVPYIPAVPSVMTLHDLSPWMDNAWHSGAARVRRRTPFVLGLGLATLVITPTETVRKAALETFRLSPARIVAVPHAARKHFQPQQSAPPPEPYFLFVGTLEPRKNLAMLVDCWREVRRDFPVGLVLAGRRRGDCPPLPECEGLTFLGPVAEADLPALYSGALACLYPSLYEGFGLPVLEAMQCGAAVIASRDPAIAEVAGSAALLLPATDRKAWITALAAAARNPEWLSAFRLRSLERAAQFSWRRTAELTRACYEEARSRFAF